MPFPAGAPAASHDHRTRRRTSKYSLIFALFLLLLSNNVIGSLISSSSSSSSTESASETETSTAAAITFLVCSVDGSIAVVNAENGDILSFLHTHRPLVGASHPQHIVPGLDGKIYQYSDDSENDDASSENELFVLPMTVEDVLHHPVRTCTSNNNRDCGIVTGTKLTHLYAFNGGTKQLQWTQKQQQQDDDTCDESSNVVLLQREDFVVKSISASTGQEVWNITLGRFSALEFDAQQQHVDGYLAASAATSSSSDGEYTTSSSSTPSMVPSIAFGKEGKTLTAISSSPKNTLLWKRQWHAVIASVYGVRGASWVPLTVVDEPEELLAPKETTDYFKTRSTGTEKERLQLPSGSAISSSNTAFGESFEKQTYMDLLWNEIQELAGRPHRLVTDMVVYPDPDFANVDCTVRDAASGLCLLGRNPKRPQLLLLGSGVDPPMPSPLRTSGLFVTYPMAAGMFLLAVLAVFGLRVLYLQKKRQWLAHAATRRTFLSRSWHEGAAQHLSLDPRRLLSDAPATMTRSLSMPGFDPVRGHSMIRSAEAATRVHSAPQKAAPAGETESPSSSTEPIVRPANVGHIDGIPLVRYSRYRSEFRELSALGRGGFGSVFRCVNQLDGREYAIKKVHIQSEVDENGNITKEFSQRLQRVLREVKILAMLDHVNVVRYYTAWLELEEEGQGEVDNSMATTSEYAGNVTTQDDSKISRCYSSELLTGASRSATPGRRPPSSPHRRVSSAGNPLGWNDFPSDFDESLRRVRLPMEDEMDCGFTFEASETSMAAATDDRVSKARRSSGMLLVIPDEMSAREELRVANDASSADVSASLSLEEEMDTNNDSMLVRSIRNKTPSAEPFAATKPTQVRHTLYIQMQLCSQQTLGDFLATPDARKGSKLEEVDSSVDIPRALGLFFQVAQAVGHVHEQGLIHRDLKPSNCFMDDAGVVKVGDFGLSRESASGSMDEDDYGIEVDRPPRKSLGADEDNTAGVGTRSYASPEQMNGSDYDSSTDVYSLGILLFELCYPMYTGMERHIVFSKLRQREFPEAWTSGVARSFPTVHSLLLEMLSPHPSDRPTAKVVARQIESLLGEFTILSLDRKRHTNDSSIWLRVEAKADHGVLARTISLIQESAPDIRILQYGLRGQEQTEGRTAIIEFALAMPEGDAQEELLRNVLENLRAHQDIQMVRQVSAL